MTDEMICNRVQDAIIAMGSNPTAFSTKCGKGNSTIVTQFKNRKVSLATVCDVLEQFPDISAEWLLRGEGQMLRQPATTTSVTAHTITGTQIGGVGNTLSADNSILQENTRLRAQLDLMKELFTQIKK